MKYNKKIILKDGRECLLRNGTENDGKAVLDNFNLTHSETDFLLTYPDENSFTAESEAEFLKAKEESKDEIEILAIVDGQVAGTAGIDMIGRRYKECHRADVGISIAKKYWGLGIGRALMESCIECAKEAGYEQMELCVVAANERAVELYKNLGFTEFGRNPREFKSRISGYQEVIHMRLEM